MRLGLFMMPLHPPYREVADCYDRDVAQPVAADRLAMLDHLARGRFQWGIGLGGIPIDMKLMGLEPAEARSRAAEALDVVLGLWASEGRFTHQGAHFEVETPELDPVTERGFHMKPLQRPHPPIAVAASTPSSNSLRLAGARGWSPMSSAILSATHLPGHWAAVEVGAAEAGRSADRRQWRIARASSSARPRTSPGTAPAPC